MKSIRKWFRVLGPGVIAGAADDDPAGIATYSVVGAQFGNAFLWSAFATWPLMACVQMTCARVGLVSGAGLGAAIRRKLPRWVGATLAIALLFANGINIAADLAGMGEAMSLMHLGPAMLYVALFGIALAVLGVRLPYATIAKFLKWLALALVAYVIAAFLAKPDWSKVAHDVFVPSLPKDRDGWEALVAILGTTISPYLFYWQAGQEIEEQKQHDALSAERKSMVGSGDRSEKIRTYNFKENRVTDHRIGLTVHQLDLVMEGQLDEFIESLTTHYQTEKLKAEAVAA